MADGAAQQAPKKKEKPAISPEAFFQYPPGTVPHALVDIGANLSDDVFPDLDAVVARAASAGVRAIIVTGTSVSKSTDAAAVAERLGGGVFCTAGVHPHDAKEWDSASLAALEALAARPRCVAIGECGLDFNRDFSPRDAQERCFKEQVELAIRLRRPLFMHCRDAAERMSEILRPLAPRLTAPAVVHCFTGTADEAAVFLGLGLHVGFTGWICDERDGRSDALAMAARAVPLDRLLLETDSPYLIPRTIKPSKARPKRNEPCLLPHVAAAMAAARGLSIEQVAEATSANARRVFNLPEELFT